MTKNIIEIKNLIKNYGNSKVLKGIDLDIQEGDFFALLGHNGAGKTTTINILTNLVNKTSGTVKINSISIDDDFSKARKFIGVVPQEFNFDVFAKVGDIPVLQAGYYGISEKIAKERTETYLKKLGLWEKRNAKAITLSGGMKRRLMIVRALIHNPKLLILDEPTAGVDVELRKSMWEFIEGLNNTGATILLTTHYLEEVEALCKNVAIINDGKIIKNTSVKSLIASLDEEEIVLEFQNKDTKISEELQEKYKVNQRSDGDFEFTLKKDFTINELFSDLDNEKILVKSFRNKQNRIEALFMKILKK